MSKQQRAPGELERVRAFVNTLDQESGREEFVTPVQLGAWLDGHAPGGELRPSEEDLRHAIEFREALRAILLAHNTGEPAPGEAYATLDGVARRAGMQLRFERDGSSSLKPEAGGVDGALGSLAGIVHDALGDGTWQRLKACRDRQCEWAFYDHTKNRSGAWCNMQVCGNRAKARAYRQRHGTAEDA